jgi:hypothetical protein
MSTTALRTDIKTVVLADALILGAFYALPAVSHLLPIPLYLLEPMRIAMLLAFILTRSTWNAIAMGISIPIFSFLTAGHPQLIKALLISAELAVNIGVFVVLYRRYELHASILLIVSILVSKVAYYLLKYVVIVLGLLDDRLISTAVYQQLLALGAISLIISFFMPSKDRLP